MQQKFKFSDATLGAILAVTGIFLFSAKAILVKIAYQYEVDSVSLLLFRMIFAMPFYIFIAWWQLKKQQNTGFANKDLLSILFLGFIGYYLASFFDFQGLQYIAASLERLILFIYPTLVVLFSGVVFRKKITSNQWLAIIVTYMGIVITFVPDIGHTQNTNVMTGASLIFLSATSYAMYIVGSGNLIPKFGPKLFTALAMTVSCFCVIIHYSLVNDGDLWGFPWQVYFIGLCMAIFSTVIPSFLISEAIKRIGSSDFAIIGSIGPVSTIILAVIFLHEIITVYQLIGTMVVIGGISVLKNKNVIPFLIKRIRK